MAKRLRGPVGLLREERARRRPNTGRNCEAPPVRRPSSVGSLRAERIRSVAAWLPKLRQRRHSNGKHTVVGLGRAVDPDQPGRPRPPPNLRRTWCSQRSAPPRRGPCRSPAWLPTGDDREAAGSEASPRQPPARRSHHPAQDNGSGKWLLTAKSRSSTQTGRPQTPRNLHETLAQARHNTDSFSKRLHNQPCLGLSDPSSIKAPQPATA